MQRLGFGLVVAAVVGILTAMKSEARVASELGTNAASEMGSTAGDVWSKPVVELEEEVYHYRPADNGAGPMWCHGSTCLVRRGADVFASGLETLPQFQPLNNCRWTLWRRGAGGWQQLGADLQGRTREPCPLAVFDDGRLFLSANSALEPVADRGGGPARPEVLEFSAHRVESPSKALRLAWTGSPKFSEHSYRSFAADGSRSQLILFQNIGYTHAEWIFLGDQAGTVSGQLKWPWGSSYAQPQPIRVCYPNVALRNRAVHFCGVSDIMEPNPEWRAFKKKLTGQEWDYDFRRLFYSWSSDIRTGRFHDWIEIASREQTCGWITPGDMWVAPDGRVHLIWTERAVDERLRQKFFPEVRQSHALHYAVLREGTIQNRRPLLLAEEGGAQAIPGRGRFHVTPDHRLWLFYYVSGRNADGRALSENRLMELFPDGQSGASVTVPLKRPFTEFYTATTRAGSSPSEVLDLLGQQAGAANTISYARIRLPLKASRPQSLRN